MNALVKSIVTVVAIKAGTLITLIAIGAVAEMVAKKRMVKDAEHYANCPANKI